MSGLGVNGSERWDENKHSENNLKYGDECKTITILDSLALTKKDLAFYLNKLVTTHYI